MGIKLALQITCVTPQSAILTHLLCVNLIKELILLFDK